MGQPLFVATAPRSVEGRLEQTSDQWRARFTIVDLNGKILGTRELEQSAASCRDLDERLVFLVVLLIQPMVELEARPPAPRPGPPPPLPVRLPPARARLEVRGDERLVDGRVVTRPLFYQRLQRFDLVDAYWGRVGLKSGSGAVAGVLVLTAVVVFSASALGADCASWSGTPQARGVCVDRPPGLLISGVITAVLGAAGLITALALPVAPTSQSDDEQLVKVYDARR